ncbi:hypothetical protein Cgig2_007915 [Carnegiea gigantea]|uniref:DYW domain-containing protein n=1 Tax=Carnegiea gigantea TaxID=171969 RepID=A0A9Q1QH83_9CARY|nr:hypothetical protein Cgig2_007915 [Carnegiea gigantea]
MILGRCYFARHFATASRLPIRRPKHNQQYVILTQEMFNLILDSCPDAKTLKKFHAKLFADQNLYSNHSIALKLIRAYGGCGELGSARNLFDEIPEKNIIFFNVMIRGYVTHLKYQDALCLFKSMSSHVIRADHCTYPCVLKACSGSGNLWVGLQAHAAVYKVGLNLNVCWEWISCNARKVLAGMSVKDIVSWNSMVAGYAQKGNFDDALKICREMESMKLRPDAGIRASLLPAVTNTSSENVLFVKGMFEKAADNSLVSRNAMIAVKGDSQICRKKEFLPNLSVENALIDMYAKCGCLEEARGVFDTMRIRDVVSWTSMISAYGVSGQGRAGRVDESFSFIMEVPVEPNERVWGALLGACRVHSSMNIGLKAADHLFQIVPEQAGYYVLLSNIYAKAGKWKEVNKIRSVMKSKGMKKTPGISNVDYKGKVHTFLAGDLSHPQSKEIYEKLDVLMGKLKEEGYVPATDSALHDVEEEDKEGHLTVHSEKLAIAFSLINTRPPMRIRITKNLRVCGGCHAAIKFMSKVTKCEVIVRDTHGFHTFKNGVCSCSDYW